MSRFFGPLCRAWNSRSAARRPVRLSMVGLCLLMVAVLVAPVSAQQPEGVGRPVDAPRKDVESDQVSVDPGRPGLAWLPVDPDRPSADALDIESGAESFERGPSVLPPAAVEEIARGQTQAGREAPKRVDIDRSELSAPYGTWIPDKKVPAALAANERVDFAAAPGERGVGRVDADSVLKDRVRLTRPERSVASGARLSMLGKAATERLSSAGMAFEIETDSPVGVGDLAKLHGSDGLVDVGGPSGWELEIDLATFEGVLADPTAVRFVANLDCDLTGVCAEREFLDTKIDVGAWTATVEIPANVLAAVTRSNPADEKALAVGGAGRFFRPVFMSGGGGNNISVNGAPWGEDGNYSASSIGSVASWQVGLQTGHAELSYPLVLPSAPGPVPDLDLLYSSGMVDGLSKAANGQPSRLGLGWAEPVAVVTRSVRSCDPDPDRLCPAFGRHDGFSVSFGGVSSPLVRLTADAGVSHPDYPSGVTMWEYIVESRNDWRIRRVEQPGVYADTSRNNGDVWNAWWEITTGDGTLFVFGRERALDPTVGSGPATTWERTDVHTGLGLESLLSAPLVFDVGDRKAGCVSAFCEAGITWHLDQVIDTSGNRAIYYYDSIRNWILPNGWNTTLAYDREVRMTAVHWGQRYDTTPPAWDGWSPFKATTEYGSRQDVPDFTCSAAGTENTCSPIPSFYAENSLRRIKVHVNDVFEYGWQFTHHIDPSDLWLNDIQRIEPDGTGVLGSLAPVRFTKKHLPNRVVALNGEQYYKPRIETMTTEAGGEITFEYSQSAPPAYNDTNNVCYAHATQHEVRRPCDMYPTPDEPNQDNNGTLVWWNKHKVSKVTVDPAEGNSQHMVTDYTYDVTPDWAWTARYPAAGEWNDYRGHRKVTVDDNSGTTVTHFFATGMWDDHYSETNANALGIVNGSTVPAKVEDPWGLMDNRVALAGEQVGRTERRNNQDQWHDITRFNWVAISGSQTPADFASPTYISKVNSWSEIYNGESTWVARTKVEQWLDQYGRLTQEVDHGKTEFNGNPNSNYSGDERTTATAHNNVTGPWIMSEVQQTDLHDGTTTSGTVIGSTSFLYDDRGRVTETAVQRETGNSDRQRTTFEYESRGLLETQISHGDNNINSDNQETDYVYDTTYGWLKTIDGPLSGAVDFYRQTIDPVYGVQTQTIDPNGRTTDLTYDSLGRVKTVRLPDTPSGYNSFEFDYLVSQAGVDRVETKQLWSQWATDKYITSWAFLDGLGRTIQTQTRHQGDNSKAAVSSTRYDNLGRGWEATRPTYRTTASGSMYWENWSNLGVAHMVTTYPAVTTSSLHSEGCNDGENVEVSYRTDTNTEWASSLSTSCGLTERSWNRDAQLSSVTSDVRGNQLASTDTAGNTTQFEYNVRDQLTKVFDPALNTTDYTFANWGIYGPTQIDDPDHGLSTYAYDDHGRLERHTDARGVQLGFGYDLANRPRHTWHINSGWQTVSEMKYDFSGGFGQLGQEIHWNRDTNGTSAGQVTVDYAYDNRGRVDTVTHDIPGMTGGAKNVSYDYYEHNQLNRITYPDGTNVEYGYDRQGRQSWLGLTDPNNTGNTGTQTVVVYTEYNASNQLTTLKRGPVGSNRALNSYYTYNTRDGSLDSNYTDSGANSQLDQYYKYDYSDAGKIWSVFEQGPNAYAKNCFWYTNENYVSKAWSLGNSYNCGNVGTDDQGLEPYEVDYSYDNLGRITNATGTGTVGGSYTYTGSGPLHAPTAANGNSYTYDSAGNRATATVGTQTTNYVHDVNGRLLSTSGPNADMLYDVGGERVRRTIGTDVDYYLASGLEIDSNGDQTISLTLAGKTVATYTPAKEIWSQNTDHLGTPTLTVTSAGVSEHYRRYTPFGAPRSNTTTGAPSDLTFTGQREDTGLGLMYYGARYYDAMLGQFVQADSLDADGTNRYAYVRNNPISFVDPTGQCASIIDGAYCNHNRTVGQRRATARKRAQAASATRRRVQHLLTINTSAPPRPTRPSPSPPPSARPPAQVPTALPARTILNTPSQAAPTGTATIWVRPPTIASKAANEVVELAKGVQSDAVSAHQKLEVGAGGCVFVCLNLSYHDGTVAVRRGGGLAYSIGAGVDWKGSLEGPQRTEFVESHRFYVAVLIAEVEAKWIQDESERFGEMEPGLSGGYGPLKFGGGWVYEWENRWDLWDIN